MAFWDWVEAHMPMGPYAENVKLLRQEIAPPHGDVAAWARMTLFGTYERRAREKRVLGPLFRHLAMRHLHKAVVAAEFFPEPLAVYAARESDDGDIGSAVKHFKEVIEKQRRRMSVLPPTSPPEDRQMTIYLKSGANALRKLGRFEEALAWLMQALESFHKIAPETRIEQSDLEDEILSGIVSCLLCLFRYDDALSFIDSELKGEMFSQYQSSTRLQLHADRDVIAVLAEKTREYQRPASGADLWAELVEEVQRCASVEAAGEARKKILTKIEMHEAGAELRKAGQAIIDLQDRHMPPAPQSPQEIPYIEPVLSGLMPADREVHEKVNRAAKALRDNEMRIARNIYEIMSDGFQTMTKEKEKAAARIRATENAVYNVRFGFRARWFGFWLLRMAVLLVAGEYLLGKIIHKLLEGQGETLLERLHFGPKELTVTVIVTVLLFFVGRYAEGKIEEVALASYRRMLLKLVANRLTVWWGSYNSLLQIYARLLIAYAQETAKALAAIKKLSPESGSNPA
jgi:tetratricopeptide (TPR) repeat protein